CRGGGGGGVICAHARSRAMHAVPVGKGAREAAESRAGKVATRLIAPRVRPAAQRSRAGSRRESARSRHARGQHRYHASPGFSGVVGTGPGARKDMGPPS
ncbi:unnamed protein product, partial [Lampetra fluviatilis]